MLKQFGYSEHPHTTSSFFWIFRTRCKRDLSISDLVILALFEDIFVRELWWIIPLRTVHNWRESSTVTSPRGIFSPAIRAQESLYKWPLKTDQSDYRKLMIFCLFYFLCCQPVYTVVRIWFDRQLSYRTKRDSEHCYLSVLSLGELIRLD